MRWRIGGAQIKLTRSWSTLKSAGLRRAWLALAATPMNTAQADEVSTGVFVRSDTDTTVVVAPRVAAAKEINGGATRFDASYSADLWSSASIDMRAAATGRIYEQRDQVTGAVSHESSGNRFGANYYFSGENDYTSHGVGVFAQQRFAKGSATIEERLGAGFDTVGRAGDPGFSFPMNSMSARLVLTQILNPRTVLQFAYEFKLRSGFQHSPYRFVGLGGDGLCGGTAVSCVPESHPDRRLLNAFVIDLRHSLAEDSALGLGYRFYIDDWGVLSHTGFFQFSSLLGKESSLTFRYRFYTQDAASFYQPVYPVGFTGNVSRDKEMSPLISNRLALSYDTVFDLERLGAVLRLALAVGLTAFIYNDFVGLGEVYSGDATTALTVEL